MSNVPQDVLDDLELVRAVLEGFKDCMPKSDGLAAYQRLKNHLAQRSNAEPVGLAVKVTRGSDGRLLLTQPDGKYFDVNEAIGKTFHATLPDYAAGVAAGMMKAAEICGRVALAYAEKMYKLYKEPGEFVMEAKSTVAEDLKQDILSAIPADSKAALREVCMKVAIQVYVSRNIISRKNDDADLIAIVDAKIGGRDHV